MMRAYSEGRVDEAGALLGHTYAIDGTVMRGDQRGRTIGFPTANVCSENELLPPHGVYATTTRIRDVVHASVTNVGVRSTARQGGSLAHPYRIRPGEPRVAALARRALPSPRPGC